MHKPLRGNVIGAGIIGVCCGLAMQARGHNVILIDRSQDQSGASYGNAGAFAFSDVVPLASPGIMWKAPKWLLDPLGPLSIPPSYAMKILPWMVRFWRSSWRDKFHGSMSAQSALMDYSKKCLETQLVDAKAEHMLRREGALQLYESETEFQASLPNWAERKKLNIPFRHLNSAAEIAEIQPGLSSKFCKATFTPQWCNICNPADYIEHLTKLFIERGGKIIHDSVDHVLPHDNGIEIVTSKNGTVDGDKLVVASGAWSKKFTKILGDNVPLETERGYNTTLPAEAFDLKTQLIFGGHGFVISRIGEGVRVGGAVELGGLELPPNYKRSQALLDKAKQFLSGFKDDNGKQWMGFRSSMPDSLPVIGASAKNSNIIYAFGHGHLGLTQSSGTAQLVADLVENKNTEIDIRAFSANRF